MRLISICLLRLSKRFFLWAHGWKKRVTVTGECVLNPPNDYVFESKRGLDYGHSHAVNSQKAAIRELAFLARLGDR